MSENNIIDHALNLLGMSEEDLSDWDNRKQVAKVVIGAVSGIKEDIKYIELIASKLESINKRRDIADIILEEESRDINHVKQTCKKLGMTQKSLASYMGVSEDTLGKWARGVVETPKWAVKMFELLEMEKDFNTVKEIIYDNMNKKT